MTSGTTLPKITITRATGPVQTVTHTIHEVLTAVKHRPWKGALGSPIHHHGKPSTIQQTLMTEYVLLTSPTASAVIEEALPTTTSCIEEGAGTADTPAMLGYSGGLGGRDG